jgi:hypothetical protein
MHAIPLRVHAGLHSYQPARALRICSSRHQGKAMKQDVARATSSVQLGPAEIQPLVDDAVVFANQHGLVRFLLLYRAGTRIA